MFSLTFNTDNAAFEAMDWEVTRILREVANKVENGRTVGACIDINGNVIGSWELI